MKKVLVTGFEPFDGRARNASWIAAHALVSAGHALFDLRALQIPVCWGAPRKCLIPMLQEWQPDCVVAMGEGEPGVFRLETLARNTRRERPDNAGRCPEGDVIENEGPEHRVATADCAGVQAALSKQGVPIKLSEDAGAFLCEEMLYTLEGLRENHENLQSVLFVHLPPYGTELLYRGGSKTCDEPLLLDFGQRLLNCMKIPDSLTGFKH